MCIPSHFILWIMNRKKVASLLQCKFAYVVSQQSSWLLILTILILLYYIQVSCYIIIWCYGFCFRLRYTAVAMPMLYNTRYSSRRRVTVMISVVWVLSFAISCPLLFGLNNTGKKELNTNLLHSQRKIFSVVSKCNHVWIFQL